MSPAPTPVPTPAAFTCNGVTGQCYVDGSGHQGETSCLASCASELPGIAAGAVGAALLLLFSWCWRRRRHSAAVSKRRGPSWLRLEDTKSQPLLPSNPVGAGPRLPRPPHPWALSRLSQLSRAPVAYSYEQLSLATGGFAPAHLLAEGAFGAVYRGSLAAGGGRIGGREVAIKRLKEEALALAETSRLSAAEWQGSGSFRKEMEVLSQYRHVNIVSLLGFFLGDGVPPQLPCLVFEFMAGGSLRCRLAAGRAQAEAAGGGAPPSCCGAGPREPGGAPPLTAQERFDIASDVARGLEYLHVDADPPIIHQDVKVGWHGWRRCASHLPCFMI
jgi:hypothetical protein